MKGLRNLVSSLGDTLKKPDSILLGLLMLGTVFLYGILPSLGLPVFGSPDETAVSVVADRLGEGKGVAVAEPLADEYPWLHPRSWITRGEFIVPVGFIGWPWILGWFNALIKNSAPWIAALLLISSVIPLWNLLGSYSRNARVWALLLYVTFPVMALYGNRSLFPNPAMLSLALWSTWMIKDLVEKQKQGGMHWFRFVLVGLVMALCAAIRPVELLWIVPWWAWAGANASLKHKGGLGGYGWMGVGAVLVLVPVLVHAAFTYGAPWLSGYQLRDNPPPVIQVQTPPAATNGELKFLPYGFHPRNVMWNVYWFLLNFMLPWSILLVGAALLPIIKLARSNARPLLTKEELRGGLGAILCAFWTIFILLMIYGHGLYADHVRPGAVTIGNSFLRYLLPLAPLFAWAAAEIWTRASANRNARNVTMLLFVGLAMFGPYKALAGDDEGVLSLRRELIRYASIREAAALWFKPSDVIVSERSDKIFFPAYRAATPIPPPSELGRLSREQKISIGLFARPLNQSDRDAWRKAGLDPVELATFGRERLYLLRPMIP